MNFTSLEKAFKAGVEVGTTFDVTPENYGEHAEQYLDDLENSLPYAKEYEEKRKGPQKDWHNSGYRIMPVFQDLLKEFVALYNEVAPDSINRHEAINFALYLGMEGICSRIEQMKAHKEEREGLEKLSRS